MKTLLDRYVYELSMLPFFFEKKFSTDSAYAARQQEFLDQFYAHGNKDVQAENAKIITLTQQTYDKIKPDFDAIVQVCRDSAAQIKSAGGQLAASIRQVERRLLATLYEGRVVPFQPNGVPTPGDTEDNQHYYYDYIEKLLKPTDGETELVKWARNNKQQKSSQIAQRLARIREVLKSFSASLRPLIQKRNILAEIADYDYGVFEEMRDIAVRNAEEYWKSKRIEWVRRLRQTGTDLERRIYSLPIESVLEEQKLVELRNKYGELDVEGTGVVELGLEEAFSSILKSKSFKEATHPDHKKAVDLIEAICTSPRTSGNEIPLARLSFQYGSEILTIPYSAKRDNAYFVLRKPGNTDEYIKQFFETLVYHILRNTRVGLADLYIVDPEFKGVFISKFNKKLSEVGQEKNPVTIKNISSSRDFEQLLKELQDHIHETIGTLGEKVTVEDYNERKSGLTIKHKVVIINNFSLFYGTGLGSRMDGPVGQICDIAENAKKCGITLVCCGTDELWKKFRQINAHGFDKIENLPFPPYSDQFISDSIRFGNPKFRVTEMKSLPSVTPEAIEILMDFLLQSLGSQSDVVEFKAIVEDKKLFQMISDKEVRATFGKTALAQPSAWTCSSGGEMPGQTILVGGTGSGKSNLLHAIITSACYFYSPGELQLYLIDLKQGVEFKKYADHQLPHARLVAIEGTADIALGVLRSIWDNYNKRMKDIKDVSTDDLPSFREKLRLIGRNDEVALHPRVVIVIDEFQILFTEDDRIKFEAEDLLNKIITQGRAAGFHVILATQNLTSVKKQIVDNVSTRP